MPESRAENEVAGWGVSQCAFAIEYTLRVIDDIRLEVVDAFFSLPRGGAEIGGILLGRYESRRLTISGSVALDCEHLIGPSFVLSPRDHARLAEIMASARGNPHGTYPVGWYHSHTRSDIFLSPADLDIHKRYFPEPWQVALVLKPHTFQPTRAGFFFREADGIMRATASYKEFIIEPLAVRPPKAAVAAAPGPVPRERPQSAAPLAIVDSGAPASRLDGQPMDAAPPYAVEARSPGRKTLIHTEPVHPEQAGPEPAHPEQVHPQQAHPEQAHREQIRPQPAHPEQAHREQIRPQPARSPSGEVAPPNFTQVAPRQSRRWLGLVVVVVAGLTLGATASLTREIWFPHVKAWFRSTPPAVPRPYIGLSTLDTDGQLQIRWDRNSPAVRGADGGTLVIVDGLSQQAILLDLPHLQTGAFTYGRQNERVDVTLTIRGSSNQSVKEVTTYLGKLPERQATPVDTGARKERDDLVKQLESQRSRTKKLEKSVEDMRTELNKQEKRKRFGNQSPETVK